jgi:hypothetical protein
MVSAPYVSSPCRSTSSASVLGEQSRSASGTALTDLPWLREVHKKLWNQESLRPKLFRKVEVTQSHYTALQGRLKVIRKDRDKLDYDGGSSKPDVLKVKLDFLHTLNPVEASPSQHPGGDDNRVGDDDNSEARKEVADSKTTNEIADSELSNDDDDDVLQSLFPYILEFLDLSALGLEVTDRLPLPLLLRKEYEHISELIKKKPEGSRGSVIVSGPPGTGEFLVSLSHRSNQPCQYQGKTAYLHLRIIEYMIEGRPFLFQPDRGTVYHVANDGVNVVWSRPPDEAIVAFVDGDPEDFVPQKFLIHHSVQLIVASSPKVSSEKWIKQAGNTVTQIATNLWSEKELLLTGSVLALPFNTRLKPLYRIFLNRYDLNFKLLRDSTSYFGYNPRQCFSASSSVSALNDRRDDTISLIGNAATRNDFVELFRSARSGINNVSHRIYQISPIDPDTNRLLSNCKFEPVSRWAFDLLLRCYEDKKANAAAEFYFALSGMWEAATLRGHLFERQVLMHLFRTGFEYQIRGLTDSKNVPWKVHEARRFTFEDSTVGNELTEAVMKNEPIHLVPSARNFAAVDSILYNPNDGDAVFTCIQVKVNRKHPISVKGLRKIQSYLKRDTLLDGLRPSIKRPWRFVFVVESPKASTFGPQDWIDDTSKGEWAGKVHQYVLEFEEETLFKARPDSIVQHATTSQQGDQQVRC